MITYMVNGVKVDEETFLKMENWLWKEYIARITKWQERAIKHNQPIKVQFT